MLTYYGIGDTDPRKHAQNLELLDPGPWGFPSIGAFTASRPDIFDLPSEGTYWAQGNYNPDMAVITDETTILVLCRGMQGTSLVQKYLDAANVSSDELSRHGMSCFVSAANLLFDGGRFGGSNARKIVVGIGHSYGGGVITALYKNMNPTLQLSRQEFWTYGAPRSHRSSAGGRENAQFVRVVNELDPVPSLIPHLGNQPVNSWFYPPAIWTQWNDCVHPRGVLVMDDEGHMVYQDEYNLNLGRTALEAAAWMASDTGFTNNNHGIDAYKRRVWASLPWAENAPTIIMPVGQPDAETNTVSENRAAFRAMLEAQMANDGGAPNATLARVAAQIADLPTSRFRRKTWHGVRAIVYGDEVVAVAPTRRKQTLLCNLLNRRLRAS